MNKNDLIAIIIGSVVGIIGAWLAMGVLCKVFGGCGCC